MADIMLSTSDNPFNPFTQWSEWYAYDALLGHHTPEYLARIVRTSYDLSDAEQEQDIVDAINEIVELNINGLYIKVTEPDVDEVAHTDEVEPATLVDAIV